ncbi:MAG: hypothetical protein RIR26_1827 [Pseudomonadota bacterium]|jgi:hypothetical protein
MLKRSHFTVDLWFIFGSFCYGAEASLVACRSEQLILKIKSPTQQAESEIIGFFEQLEEKSKALVRTEIRLFVNSNPDEQSATDWAEELVTTLMTEQKPRLLSSAVDLQIELNEARGLTPDDQTTWVNLVTDIWPQLPA